MIISRSPLRVSFFGGGTDYPEYFLKHGGAVLATAIDKYSFVTASRFYSHLFDYAIRIQYREVEAIKAVDDIRHVVFRECLKYCGLDRDIELHTVADLPAFTGLGSSSSFTAALLLALHAFKGEFATPLQVGYEAIHVERHLIKDAVGCQDQMTAAVGGFNLLEFRREDDIVVHRLPLAPQRLAEFEQHLFLVFTGMSRRAGDLASRQIQRVDDNAAVLRRMHAMAEEGWQILTGSAPLCTFGELLHEAWLAKRSLDGSVSNPAIDALYQRGMEAGALGGKLLGAGGGGFLLFFAPPERHVQLQAAFADRVVLEMRVNAPGAQIIFA